MNEPTAMDDAALRDKLWQPTADERRKALMPFFWGTLAPAGIVLGNVAKGSSVRVKNRYHGSYPGYSEILTGRTQDEAIKSNRAIQNPTPSVFQFLRQKAGLQPEQVPVFASWSTFGYISENRRGDLFINAGYERASLPFGSPPMDLLNRLQFEALFPDTSARHDAFTFHMAMVYLDHMQPEHLFIAFDETDDWAHQQRYDMVLRSLAYFDQALGELWDYIQRSPAYRGSTTLVITADHGRGSTVKDWTDHGPDTPGDDQSWVAFIGPDTAATGEASNSAPCFLQDIAPTMLALLGIDPAEYMGMAGQPIREALSDAAG